MMKTALTFILAIAVLPACMTRAPTTYELDRRAGFAPPGEPSLSEDVAKLHTAPSVPRNAVMPIRLPPVVEKIWIADQTLADGVKLQGTWMFVEVEPGRWLDAGEPSPALATTPLAPAPQTTK